MAIATQAPQLQTPNPTTRAGKHRNKWYTEAKKRWCKRPSPAFGAQKRKGNPTLPSHTRNSKPSNPVAAPSPTPTTPNEPPQQKAVRLAAQLAVSGPAVDPNPSLRPLPPPSRPQNTANVQPNQPTPRDPQPSNRLSCSLALVVPRSTLHSPITIPNLPHHRRSRTAAISIASMKTTNPPPLRHLLEDPNLRHHWHTIIADATGLAQGGRVVWRVPRYRCR
jgi:hypothetical protein